MRESLAKRVKGTGEDEKEIWMAQILSRYLGYALAEAWNFGVWATGVGYDEGEYVQSVNAVP